MSELELHRWDSVDRGRDDLDEFLDEELRDPEFRGAYEDAMARSALLRALVDRRGERRLSQSEVAALMGTTQSAVSDLERGATDPRLSTLQRFARAISCQLRLQLYADRPRHRSWLVVQVPAQVAWPTSRASGYWEPLLAHLTGTGRARPAALGSQPTTRVAPVELRAEPDEFAQAAVK